ncbi:MAG TPA: hypothetical protein VHW66_09690 [Stellaceae bacterium]|jgi:hypothetical protein|nr:hypothetical protein [Stellaceae bacterium]
MGTFEARGGGWRCLVVAALALLPAACADFGFSPRENQIIGVWTTSDKAQVSFREDTVVLSSPSGAATPITASECNGGFFFHYGRMTSQSLSGIAAAQPDVSKKLSAMLVAPVYPVAELGCDHGTSTYVMLDDHDLVAIYRDRDVVGLDRMTRP